MDIVQIWKRIGETPLQALQRTRTEYGIPDCKKSCYTGRLDPMAQGAMTLLLGDQVHQAKRHNSSSKTYRFQAILGISTTSYDPLGRITNIRQVSAVEAEQFMSNILQLNGNLEQFVPPCSAYRYKGKPLWKHSSEGTLPDVLPTKTVKLYSIKHLQAHPTLISFLDYRKDVMDDIKDTMALSPEAQFDFQGIKSDWKDVQPGQIANVYRICFETKVGSGTFVRSLVYDIAHKLGIPAHTFRITRLAMHDQLV